MVCAAAEMEQGVVSEGQAAEGGVSVAWVLFQARQKTSRAERVSSCGWSPNWYVCLCGLSQKCTAPGVGRKDAENPPQPSWRGSCPGSSAT